MGQAATHPARAYMTADGKRRKSILLASGYWGITRHFHYVAELAMALCWALPAGSASLLPYLYFVFLVGLLFDRARRDDIRCGQKYGQAWISSASSATRFSPVLSMLAKLGLILVVQIVGGLLFYNLLSSLSYR